MKKILYLFATLLFVILMQTPLSAEAAEESTSDTISIRYVIDGEECEVTYNRGEIVTPPEAKEKEGYLFIGWTTDFGEIYSFTKPIEESVTLKASYTLIPAVAIIENLSFVYDGQSRELTPSGLYHALDDKGGYYTFEWYKGGELISNSQSISVKNVSDSGNYSCKVTFHYGNESVRTSFDNVKATIEKCALNTPAISPKVYTGELCTPDVISSPLYTYNNIYPISAGMYEMVFTLTDSENYKWNETDESSISSTFEVMRAPNKFESKIDVFDIYIGAEKEFTAKSDYGTVKFLYSKSRDGVFSEAMPTGVGSYFVKAVVAETENYFGLESNPIPFAIIDPSASNPNGSDGDVHTSVIILLMIFILAISSLSILMLILNRAAKRRTPRVISKSGVSGIRMADTICDDEECEGEFSIQLRGDCEAEGITDIMGIDADKANRLITDTLAKSLIRRENTAIVTGGSGRVRVSVNTLSDHFHDGDTVDINSLKEKGIVPYDALNLEIEGAGYLNKSLKVYASDFSLCAVKMIALCGGEAIKVVTVKRRDNKKY